MSGFEKNLSSGSVVKQLFAFALPMLISNLIQSLYSVADMIIVGQFCGAASMSGVNIGGQITMVLTNMVFGLCVGGTVLIAQYLGHGDRKELAETVSTLFTFLVITAAVICAVMLPLNGSVLRLIDTPPESFSEASSYLFITMCGCIFIFMYNALSAVMRGMGDSKRPMYFVLIACVVNVGLDLLFVAKYKMGAAGAAIATVISQAISVLLCIGYLRAKEFVFDFRLRSFGINKERLGMLLRIGIPTSVQNTVVGMSFIFMTALVNGLGVTASAAVGAVAKVNNFGLLPAMAMSGAIAAMSGQNIGAGETKRASDTMLVGTAMGAAMSLCVYFIVRFFPGTILRVFCDEPEVISAGIQYIRSFSLDYLIVPYMFGMNGLFIGSGHTKFTLMNAVVTSLLLRVPFSYLFGISMGMGLYGLGLGGPVASAAGVVFGVIFYLSGRWKSSTVIRQRRED